MDTSIAQRNNTDLAIPGYVPVAGLDELDPDDFSIPTLKLVQAQTTGDGADEHQGQWLRTDTKAFSESPKLIMIGIAKSRIMFEKPYNGQKEPLCRSDNANEPRYEYMGKQIGNQVIPGDCNKTCPFAKWGPNGERPACDLVDNWAAITEEGDPVIIRFSGSAAKVGTQLKNLARAASIKKQVLFIQLGSKKETGKIGKYFVPTVTLLTEAPPPDLVEIASSLMGINLAAKAAAESTEYAGEQRQGSGPVPDFDDGPPMPDDGIPF